MRKFFLAFLKDEEGATALEYALLLGLVSFVIVAGISQFTTSFETFAESFGAALNALSFS